MSELTVSRMLRALPDPLGRDMVPDVTHLATLTEDDGTYVAVPVDRNTVELLEQSPEYRASFEAHLRRARTEQATQ